MEFWGFIYDKRYDKRDTLGAFNQTKEYDEHSINSDKIKKYYANGKWIFSTTADYLKTIDLRNYIKRADDFAKIQLSTDSKILKFDYVIKGKFKKQLVIMDCVVLSNIGFDTFDFSSMNLTEIFDKVLWEVLGFDSDFIEPHDSYFKMIKSIPYKTFSREIAFDLYLILSIPKAILAIIASPIFAYYLTRGLILILSERELLTLRNLVLLLIAWSASVFLPIYLIRLAYLEIKNFIMMKTKVFNDEIITLPNNKYT
jgi:hypothetical protein